MVAKELDENKLREKLIDLYEKFLLDNNNKEVLEEMSKIDRDYGNADDLISVDVLNEAIVLAGNIQQKVVFGENSLIENEDVNELAKEMLEKLKY